MATQVSYGQISIVDISDVGTLSVYPTSNMPLSVIYDPNQNGYTPNWATNNLTVTPVIYYSGHQLMPGATGLTISWTRQEGIASPTERTSGETVSNGVLTVSANKFSTDSTTLSYIVTVSYLDPEVGQTLTAEGKITFSLVKMASNQKNAKILGDTVIKYNTSGSIDGASSITLTAEVNNVSITKWQYLNSSGVWTDISNSAGAASVTISASTSAYWENDKCQVKLITSDASVYDLHTIVKLRDGAAGTLTVAAVLTNEDQMIPCDADNNPISSAFDDAVTQIIVYRGGTVETDGWRFSVTPTNVTWSSSADGESWTTRSGSSSNMTHSYYKIRSITSDIGKLTITASKSGETSIVKTFSLVKIKPGIDGADAVVYMLSCDTLAVNQDISGVCTPDRFYIRSYKKQGEQDRASYAGRFRVYAGSASSSATPIYESTGNQASYNLTTDNVLAGAAAGKLTVELYKAGGTTTKLDTQTVVFTSDGATGAQGQTGATGEAAINVVLGNESDVLPCGPDNKLLTACTVRIPFAGYKGTSRVTCTVDAASSLPKLCNVTPTKANATTSADGYIQYVLPSGTAVSEPSGTLTFSFYISGQTIVHVYRWSRANSAENAAIFQLYAPNGNIFNNGTGTVQLVGQLMNGSSDDTASVTNWAWAKFTNGEYVAVTGSSSTYTVSPSEVDGYASYRCQATYSGKTYTAYYSVIDKTDPLQVTVFSSIGEQIINSQGVGALYAKVAKNGVEIDALKSETFSTTAPANPSSGDYYYKLNTTNKSVLLMKYTGSAWATASSSDQPKGTYTWHYRDKNGDSVTPTGMATTGKVVYIDATMIDKKLIADVEVSISESAT